MTPQQKYRINESTAFKYCTHRPQKEMTETTDD